MNFPARMFVKEYQPVYGGDGFFWKSLCVVYDNESLGLVERLLKQSDLEYMVEERQPTAAEIQEALRFEKEL